MSDLKLYLAPLQGITDHVFRNIFNKFFPGLHKTFTPFVRFKNDLEIKKSQISDILPENNALQLVTPQILSNKASEIIFFASYVKDLGYSEINWNLGCPFPMVANRKLGSGLLQYNSLIDEILKEVFPKIQIDLSVKMRLGYSNNQEIYPIIEVLNKYPVSEIIIHPRIGKQMYKGEIDLESFAKCIISTNHKLSYNGEINCFDDFRKLSERFETIHTWMLGRGAVANPFLVESIAQDSDLITCDKLERFSLFHAELIESYEKNLSGPGHLLDKMIKLWEFFSKSFDDQHKAFKMIKKAGSIEKYNLALYYIYNNMHYKA
jgi:tRNA-dihydrouridine synthase B